LGDGSANCLAELKPLQVRKLVRGDTAVRGQSQRFTGIVDHEV
jgi:hypothetical protein